MFYIRHACAPIQRFFAIVAVFSLMLSVVPQTTLATYTTILGCTDSSALNYNPLATGDDGSCTYPPTDLCLNVHGSQQSLDGYMLIEGSCYILGCMNSGALNYNPLATRDDNSCEFLTIPGCMDTSALNYNPLATETDGSCVYPVLYGCTDTTALNYNPVATMSDDSCVYREAPKLCTDETALNYGDPLPCSYAAPVCDSGKNLLTNGSFESETVTLAILWERFSTVTGWAVAKVSNLFVPTTLEHHRGWMGNAAADGAQYVELDGDEPTRISQNVTTEEGATYVLSWAFAPRQSTSAIENNLGIEVDGVQVATEGPMAGIGVLTVENWITTGKYEFVANNTETEIAFRDLGPEAAGNSADVGTFLDNVVLCRVEEPVYGCMDSTAINYNEAATTEGDVQCEYENTDPAPNVLTCSLTADDQSVGRGQEFTLSWDTEYAESVSITGLEGVLGLDGSRTTSVTTDTTFVLTAMRGIDEAEHEVVTCEVAIDVRSGGGGGGGRNGTTDTSDDGDILGAGGSLAEPSGEVLGERIDVLPLGAPNTGAGGASAGSFGTYASLLGMFISLMVVRVTKHA